MSNLLRKYQTVQRIIDVGVVAVVRAETEEQAKKIADACIAGGVTAIEMTFTVPDAHKVMESLAQMYSPEQLILGAGTVLDPETARIAILSGASYVVTPMLSLPTVTLCNRYHVPVMPGAATAKEAVEALEAGADVIKVFPGELYGPKVIKALKGPLPQANFMPTGGVTPDNAAEWIKAGAVAIGAGGALSGPAAKGDYAGVTENAKKFIAAVKSARS
ncbi:hypothetical protein P22_2268 [Propionispora sp. 2/2-37]|uniref:bifunctional 2-keto-4-hydroxyglutarate aldolase/2-keto-3-deoxy-6-phosphogluconate aldolase n=1 Tax=Propionispora sp. 2/2-37 TaxID=1677858 RepID=UPI0006BB80AD|nr:bifunctional 2-keto-4-hydroxyglutarate aldolase/2-keto-3-deoxy-6-phosphogluconate aldolase [Propionispora sp. 2/2-37]CUH96179.1 hypothetical protein P22_2268 [Propionispora sp. 2/2-37]